MGKSLDTLSGWLLEGVTGKLREIMATLFCHAIVVKGLFYVKWARFSGQVLN